MAIADESLCMDEFIDGPPLHRVHVLDIDRADRWDEISAFCQHSDQAGRFDWDPEDCEFGDRQDATFFFTDEVTAFHFKMRFG